MPSQRRQRTQNQAAKKTNRRTREWQEFERVIAERTGVSTPRNAMRRLFRAALHDNNQGRAARYFLFWLDGEVPPDGPSESGASDLMDFTDEQKEAAFEVLRWWITFGRRVESLLTVLENIRRQFTPKTKPSTLPKLTQTHTK
jgi:hypothetical protein